MADDPEAARAAIPETGLRDADGNLTEAFVASVQQAIAARKAKKVRELAGGLLAADLADLLLALEPEQRPDFIRLLGSAFDYAALTELDENIRVDILDALPPEAVAKGVSDLDSDDAVYILEDLDSEDQAEILAKMPAADRIVLQRGLEYPESSAGRRMQVDIIAVPPFWTVGQTIDFMRSAEDLPDDFYELFVVDPAHRLIGTVALNRLLRSRREIGIKGILEETTFKVKATDDQEEVARLFERYDLVSVPVTDDADRLVGVIMVDDVVDVIQEEADEDIKRLAGVGDEEVSDSVWEIVRGRSPWLLVNLGTAFLASAVIDLFSNELQAMVALAVLMPIVASMGGNAATQTMTVVVRALATREIHSQNTGRVIWREAAVGLAVGGGFAVLIGFLAFAWFHNPDLGIVMGAAILINLMAAALGGTLIPLVLSRIGADPAIASGTFVTTVTDVVGFFSFLGLAGLWFGLR